MQNYTENLHEVLPAAIAEADRWLLWKSVANNGSKPRKVPFYADGSPRNGALDTDGDRGRLVGLEDAIAAYRANPGVYTGLGFALGPDGTGECWQGVDLDDIEEHNLGHIALPGYVERSPSGKGLHAIGLGMEFRGLGSNGSGVEAYARGRYFTMTGDVVQAGEPVDLAPFVSGVLEKLHTPHREKHEEPEPELSLTRQQYLELRSALAHVPSDDRKLWVDFALVLKQYGTQGRGLWFEWSQAYDKYDADDAQRVWSSARPEGRVGLGTIFYEAQKRGWTALGRGGEEPPPQEEEQEVEHWPPPRNRLAISKEELDSAKLSPRCIVEHYLYADVAQIVAPGGTGKTTMLLHESVCIVLGRKVWGLEVRSPGWVLFCTKEDMRDRLVARLREIMIAMDISETERKTVLRDVQILDVTGTERKLITMVDRNITRTAMADKIVQAYKSDPPAMVVFDPLVSFGASEQAVNDNEQGIINVARKIMTDLDCCVRFVHHTGKSNARERTTDQYSGRGGSAMTDGTRMTAVVTVWDEKEPLPVGLNPADGISITKLDRPKVSFAPPGLPTIWLRREGYSYEYFYRHARSAEEANDAKAEQLLRFLTARLERPEYHTGNSLDDLIDVLGMSRKEMRAAKATLLARALIVEAPIPREFQHGGRKTFLCPANLAARYGEVEEK